MSASTRLTPRYPYALPSPHLALAERLALASTRQAEREANAAAIRAAGYGAHALAAERRAGMRQARTMRIVLALAGIEARA